MHSPELVLPLAAWHAPDAKPQAAKRSQLHHLDQLAQQ
jgi:hypothetical protein